MLYEDLSNKHLKYIESKDSADIYKNMYDSNFYGAHYEDLFYYYGERGDYPVIKNNIKDEMIFSISYNNNNSNGILSPMIMPSMKDMPYLYLRNIPKHFLNRGLDNIDNIVELIMEDL